MFTPYSATRWQMNDTNQQQTSKAHRKARLMAMSTGALLLGLLCGAGTPAVGQNVDNTLQTFPVPANCIPRLTGDGVSGLPFRFTDLGPTMLDRRTWFEWSKKNSGGGPCMGNLHGVETLCTWNEAAGPWLDRVNSERYGGKTGWRLPTVKELYTLIDMSGVFPAIAPAFGRVADGTYWSIRSYFNTSSKYFVGFNSANVSAADPSTPMHVIAVRNYCE